MVKNPPSNGEDMGLIPGLGGSLHVSEQLSSCTTATEVCAPRAGAL